jgi:hypothetical protein
VFSKTIDFHKINLFKTFTFPRKTNEKQIREKSIVKKKKKIVKSFLSDGKLMELNDESLIQRIDEIKALCIECI